MIKSDYTITFVCHNQLDFTKAFVASLDPCEVDFSRIVAVDNASTDGTQVWLNQQGLGFVILNSRNLGCGVAWNQGALALQSRWTIVMNNDVICARGWLENLIDAAELNDLHIASPAMIEGKLDYDFPSFAGCAEKKMRSYLKIGYQHAVCMAIREDVWGRVGYFMPVPRLLGFEDAIFFRRAREASLRTGTSADSWIHHYGSITQRAIKLENGLKAGHELGNRNLMREYMNQS